MANYNFYNKQAQAMDKIAKEIEDILRGNAATGISGTSTVPAENTADKIQHDIESLGLTKNEFEKIFSLFLPVAGLQEQIIATLSDAAAGKENTVSSMFGNIIVQSEYGNGGEELAVCLCKALRTITGQKNVRGGKITAEALNRHDPSDIAAGMAGGYLVITNAGGMDYSTVSQMDWMMGHCSGGMTVLLVDNRQGIKKIQHTKLAGKFTSKIKVPLYTSDEIIRFSRAYARQHGYVTSDLADMTLYKAIQASRKNRCVITLESIEQLLDGAMGAAKKASIKEQRLISDGRIVIKAEDLRAKSPRAR